MLNQNEILGEKYVKIYRSFGADYASARAKGCQNFNVKTVADPGFFKGRGNPSVRGRKPVIWQDFHRKLHENAVADPGGAPAPPPYGPKFS